MLKLFKRKTSNKSQLQNLIEAVDKFDTPALRGLLELHSSNKLVKLALEAKLEDRLRKQRIIDQIITGSIPTLLGVICGAAITSLLH